MLVEALQSFEHSGSRRKHSQFTVSEPTAKELVRAGLVRIVDQRPQEAAGTKSSASPAAPVSPQTTVSESESGDTRPRKRAASSSQTPRLD